MKRRQLPAALAVITLASGCGGVKDRQPCNLVPVPAAAVVTFQCSDGRTCSAPRFEEDGGAYEVYQICPGINGCATLVAADGTSMAGYC